jgi:hypothetical protein
LQASALSPHQALMETVVKKTYLSLVFGLLACAVSTTASAAGIGLNFASEEVAPTGSALAPGDIAGVVPQANWNNFTGANGTDVGSLELNTGGPSTATVTWASPNTWASTRGTAMNNQFPAGGNRNLMTGYIDSNNAAGVSMVTVNNIDPSIRSAGYDVYVYFLGDSQDNRGGGYTLTSGSQSIVKYGSTLGTATAHVEDPGTDVDNSLDGTYLRFRNVTGSSFTVTGDARLTTPVPPIAGQTNGFRAPINAIQIVAIPEPAGALLACGAALFGVMACRRRKL